MNVLLLNTQDTGGAARACLRLHQGLRERGVDVRVLVLHRRVSDDPSIVVLGKRGSKGQRGIDKFRRRRWMRRNAGLLAGRVPGFDIFSFPDAPYAVTWHPAYLASDVVNLHWVADFLNYAEFFPRNLRPLVWTLHDMYPFTGGCHYAGVCEGFRSACEHCPQLEGTRNPDFSRTSFARKARALARIPDDGLVIVALSHWLLDVSLSSTLFRRFEHRLIPNGLDSRLYRLLERRVCRDILALPQEEKIILFVGDDLRNARKGYRHFRAMMQSLAGRTDIRACVVGRRSGDPDLPRAITELGPVADERLMNILYSAADATVITSLEDNLPNTVMESLMSGTPVAGFAVGGVRDMVRPGLNGLMVPPGDSGELARAVESLLAGNGHARREATRRDAVERYDLPVQAGAYTRLYDELINRRKMHS